MKKIIRTLAFLCLVSIIISLVSCKKNDMIFASNDDGTYEFAGIKASSKLTDINIPSEFKGCPVTIIGSQALYRNSNVVSVTIPDSVTVIGNAAFFACDSLVSVTMSKQLTKIESEAFRNCSALTNTMIPYGVTYIGAYAFSNCSSLNKITIPETVIEIDWYAFNGCDQLIQSEEGIRYVDKWIIDCGSLKAPGNLRNDTVGISGGAFTDCENLQNITIPATVKGIGAYAFLRCKALTQIIFEGTVDQWNKITFGKGWNEDVPATKIICSDGVIELR